MYITETSESVINIIQKISELNDKDKLEFMIYLINSINGGQLNDKGIVNPTLNNDEDLLIIFNFNDVDIANNFGDLFINHLFSLYNHNAKVPALEDNGSIMGVNYSENVKKSISVYEKLSFLEKLDTLAELVIRYGNLTYYESGNYNKNCYFDFDGFEVANYIMKFKQNI